MLKLRDLTDMFDSVNRYYLRSDSPVQLEGMNPLRRCVSCTLVEITELEYKAVCDPKDSESLEKKGNND